MVDFIIQNHHSYVKRAIPELEHCSIKYAIGTDDSLELLNIRERFLDLAEDLVSHDETLCQRLKYKSMVLSEISSHEPEHRILSLLKYYKTKNPPAREPSGRVIIPYTRQQLADMSGFRVETVICTVKKWRRTKNLPWKDTKSASDEKLYTGTILNYTGIYKFFYTESLRATSD